MKKYIAPALLQEKIFVSTILAGSINIDVTNNSADDSDILIKEDIWGDE